MYESIHGFFFFFGVRMVVTKERLNHYGKLY